MIRYPVLRRTSMLKLFEFDDVEYTVALIYAMGVAVGAGFRDIVEGLELESHDVAGLLEDAQCNHCLPFGASVCEVLARFGAVAQDAVPSYTDSFDATRVLSLFIGLLTFNTSLDEATALYETMCDGTLDWLTSEDFRSLPVPLNEVVAEWKVGRTAAA